MNILDGKISSWAVWPVCKNGDDMTLVGNRFFKFVCSGFWFACACGVTQGALAEESQKIPWEEQPLVLNQAIKDYVNSEDSSAQSKIKLGTKIRVLYLGFSEEEIEKNAASFPTVPEFEFVHLPYGRKKYYDFPINMIDYQTTDTIVALNLDLSKELKDWGEGLGSGDVEVSEILDPRGQYIHNLAWGLYRLNLRGSGVSGTAVDLGPPLDNLKGAEFYYREDLLDKHCSSATEFVEYDDERPQFNGMIVYSAAMPASKEQIDCLIAQALIFTRPASVPFRSVLKLD
jgi:hypothetical protein